MKIWYDPQADKLFLASGAINLDHDKDHEVIIAFKAWYKNLVFLGEL
jgi:hypothetical protein